MSLKLAIVPGIFVIGLFYSFSSSAELQYSVINKQGAFLLGKEIDPQSKKYPRVAYLPVGTIVTYDDEIQHQIFHNRKQRYEIYYEVESSLALSGLLREDLALKIEKDILYPVAQEKLQVLSRNSSLEKQFQLSSISRSDGQYLEVINDEDPNYYDVKLPWTKRIAQPAKQGRIRNLDILNNGLKTEKLGSTDILLLDQASEVEVLDMLSTADNEIPFTKFKRDNSSYLEIVSNSSEYYTDVKLPWTRVSERKEDIGRIRKESIAAGDFLYLSPSNLHKPAYSARIIGKKKDGIPKKIKDILKQASDQLNLDESMLVAVLQRGECSLEGSGKIAIDEGWVLKLKAELGVDLFRKGVITEFGNIEVSELKEINPANFRFNTVREILCDTLGYPVQLAQYALSNVTETSGNWVVNNRLFGTSSPLVDDIKKYGGSYDTARKMVVIAKYEDYLRVLTALEKKIEIDGSYMISMPKDMREVLVNAIIQDIAIYPKK